MIKMNSISGIVCYVRDLDKTAAFYETLGFRPGERDDDSFKVYVNWFWIKFNALDKEHADIDNNNAGSYTCIKVDSVDEYYEFVLSKSLKPEGEPVKVPSGNREFILRDPDGYKLAFFETK